MIAKQLHGFIQVFGLLNNLLISRFKVANRRCLQITDSMSGRHREFRLLQHFLHLLILGKLELHVLKLELLLIVLLQLRRKADILLYFLPYGGLYRPAFSGTKGILWFVFVVGDAGDPRAPNPDIKQRTGAELGHILA